MKFHYTYVPDRSEWIGIVVVDAHCVTIACEATEDELLTWWQTYQDTEGRAEADMYDRAAARPPN